MSKRRRGGRENVPIGITSVKTRLISLCLSKLDTLPLIAFATQTVSLPMTPVIPFASWIFGVAYLHWEEEQ